jgi:NAD(P)-dependent dehydrogenase (short-subunit alcohol dehydrogenase family)
VFDLKGYAMRIEDSVALVTGANRGIGAGFVRALLERGAKKVYASARDEASLASIVDLDRARIVPVRLDVTNDMQVDAAARSCSDVDLLINNAGIAEAGGFISHASLDGPRREMEVNFWGQVAMVRAFAPILSANGGGGIIQILSIGAMTCVPRVGTYCASKFAAHAMTKGVRAELAGQKTRVMAVFSGSVESDMSAKTPGPKISALTHGHNCLGAFEFGVEECYPDFMAQERRDQYRRDPEAFDRRYW